MYGQEWAQTHLLRTAAAAALRPPLAALHRQLPQPRAAFAVLGRGRGRRRGLGWGRAGGAAAAASLHAGGRGGPVPAAAAGGRRRSGRGAAAPPAICPASPPPQKPYGGRGEVGSVRPEVRGDRIGIAPMRRDLGFRDGQVGGEPCGHPVQPSQGLGLPAQL